MVSLTEALVDLIRRKPVTDEDLVAASHFVLDAVACALGGQATPAARTLTDWYRDSGRDLGRRAFVVSGLGHALEIDDLHRDSVTHPGCVVVPLAWLMSHALGRSGREMLTAVLHGYEAMTRIGMAVGPGHYKLWHNTSTCGTFGAAMAAASLLELDRTRTVWALGNAGTQSSGLWQFLPDKAMSKHLHASRAAEAGWIAAGLAAKGFTGPERILEGEQGFFNALCSDARPDAVLAAPDAPWQLRRTSMKPWPCCRHTHPAIDAALSLHRTIVNGRDPIAVVVRSYQAALDVCDRPAANTEYTAKFSLQHCVAAALVDGDIGFDSFDDEQRQRLRPMAAKVSLELARSFEAAYPQRWGAEVELHFDNGTSLVASRRDCLGDPEQPLDPEVLTAKVRRVTALLGDAADPQSLIELALGLPGAKIVDGLPQSLPGAA
jgi:2-methylcitrate dehydratase PrpD